MSRIADALAELPAALVLAGFAARSADALRVAHGAVPRAASPDGAGRDAVPVADAPAGAGAGAGTDGASGPLAARVADRLAIGQWFVLRDRIEHLHRIDGPSFRTQAVLEGLLADIRLMTTGDDHP